MQAPHDPPAVSRFDAVRTIAGRMAMIKPERTVDAWTATYITGRRWRARLWATTERAPDERYDLGAGLGEVGAIPDLVDPEPWPDKVFVLEHKGVDEHPTTKAPIVWIRIRQLLTHLAADRMHGGQLVYYVLPDVEWDQPKKAPYGTVPSVAARRTKSLTWAGFQMWACVAHVETSAGCWPPSTSRTRPGSRTALPRELGTTTGSVD